MTFIFYDRKSAKKVGLVPLAFRGYYGCLSARRATAKSFAGCAAAWLSLLLGLRSGAFEDHVPFAAVTSTLCLSTSSRLRLALLGTFTAILAPSLLDCFHNHCSFLRIRLCLHEAFQPGLSSTRVRFQPAMCTK